MSCYSVPYSEVFLQVVNGDWHVFAPFFQLDVWESRQSEVQPQIFHRAAVHVETLQGLLQGLPSLTNIDSYDKQKNIPDICWF